MEAVPHHGVRVNADGTGSRVDGNLALGWTIVSTPSGMRFTNDKTSHGAVVSTSAVQPF